MTLIEHLQGLEDPRKSINLKHDLVDVVFLAFSAVLSGSQRFSAVHQDGSRSSCLVKPISNGYAATVHLKTESLGVTASVEF